MKASYKIALAVSVAVLILAVVLIKGEKQPQPTDTSNETAQADPAPEPRKTLRSDSPGDGSVKSLVSARPQNRSTEKPNTIASDARNRVLAARGSTEPGTPANTSTDPAGTQAKPITLNIGSNTTGPIALARTEAGHQKSETQPQAAPKQVSNQALDAIFDSSTPGKNTRPNGIQPLAGSTPTADVTPTATEPAAATANADAESTYIIQPGDTFSSIAFDVYGDEGRWVDIAQANSLADPTRLKVGQALRMPGEKQLLSQEEPSPPGPGRIQTYTINPGDSLSTVAQIYYNDPTLWRVIYNHNRDKIGKNPNAIQVDMVIEVPPQLTGAQ